MITIVLVLTIAVFLSAILFVGGYGFSERLTRVDELSSRLRSVNLEALRNLLDPAQDTYLERCLPPEQLRSVRRQRAIVAVEYVWRIAGNAALVLRAAELVRRSKTPEVAERGARIANYALRTRVTALKAVALLGLAILLPGKPIGASILEGYSALSIDIYYLTHSGSILQHNQIV